MALSEDRIKKPLSSFPFGYAYLHTLLLNVFNYPLDPQWSAFILFVAWEEKIITFVTITSLSCKDIPF